MKDKKQDKSIKKRVLRILQYGMVTLLSIPLVLTFLFKQPLVQSMAARKVTEWVSVKTGDSLIIGLLDIDFFKGIEIKHLDLRDSLGMPMMYISQLKTRPSLFKLLSGKIFFHSVSMDTVDFRLIEHKGANNYSFIKFINKLSSGNSSSPGSVFKLNIKMLKMAHFHFQLKNENEQSQDSPKNTVNYSDIDVFNASITAHNFFIVNDSIGFHLDNLTAREKSGLILRKLESDMVISGRFFSFKNMHLVTNHSQLNLDYYMLANGWDDYGDFIDSVNIVGNLRPSNLDMSDIGYFANVMFKMKDTIRILGGHVEGPISRLTGENLDIQFGRATHFKGNVDMTGLPDFYSSQITADIKNFETSVKDLRSFIIPQKDPHIPVPENIDLHEKFKISGKFNGSYYHFFTKASIETTNSGKLNLTVKLDADTTRIHQLTARFEANNFPLNHFVSNRLLLGKADFTANIEVSDSTNRQSTKFNLNVRRIKLNGYAYQNILFRGNYRSDTLFSRINITDPHLLLNSDGFTVFKKQPLFFLNLTLQRADFHALNLWKQQDFHLSGLAKINFSGLNLDSLTGDIQMEKVIVGFGNDRYPVASLYFEKRRDNSGEQLINFQSDLFDFQMNGHFRLATAGTAIGQLLNQYFPALPKEEQSVSPDNDTLRIKLLLKDPEFLGEHFIYGLNISPNTSLTAVFDLKNNTLTANGFARKLTYQGVRALENNLQIRTINNQLQTTYSVKHLILRDSTETDKTVFGLDSLRLKMSIRNDSLSYGLYWHNPDSVWTNKGTLEGLYVNNRNNQQFHISRSEVYINDTLWQVNPENKIIYSNDDWKFENIMIKGGLSHLVLQGQFPKNNGDSLSISFSSWNLSNLDLLWNMLGFDIDGTLNGNIKINRINNRNARIADLSIDKLAFNHSYLGDARILSTWNNTDNSAFIKGQVVRQGNAGRAKTIDLTGFYYPYRDTASLDLSLTFNRLKLSSINPFFNEYVSGLHGTAQGEMTLKGSVKDPLIEGYVDVTRASLIVNYLNTKYSFHQRIYFDKDKIDFGKLTLYDTLGNKAILQGEIQHHYFRDMLLNFTINTDRLLFFNTTRHMNDVYYGTAIASGIVKITGPVNDLKMEIDAKTADGTSVILPLDYSTEVADKDYIIFKSPPTDSSLLIPEETVLKIQEAQKSKYSISLNMNIQPSADLKIYLPSNMGDIQSNGSGILNLQVNSEGDMSLTGDYSVDKGEFNFSLGNFVKKHFELVKGGRISWAGDPYQATVYIKGLYKLKVNLSSLGIVVDSSADYKNRTLVNCYIIMSHDLFNPDIKFQIHFPDLDPDMQRMVYAQLDTTNTAVMNQQMISLLVLGSFSFSNASNISWNTSYYTILSNQLSSMLSKISKDFDIGVNYKPGDALTQQEFDVALSTQLFDDRLIINGNFGMTYDKQNKSANNIVGDVDIKYKITKDGRWMLKAYNHSNVNSWYYYSNYDKVSPYTQGVGVVYRKEFNSLADLFRKRDKKNKKTKTHTKKAKK